jgi:hypothetical protein
MLKEFPKPNGNKHQTSPSDEPRTLSAGNWITVIYKAPLQEAKLERVGRWQRER